MILQKFIENLRGNIRRYVMDKDSQTLDEATKLCDHYVANISGSPGRSRKQFNYGNNSYQESNHGSGNSGFEGTTRFRGTHRGSFSTFRGRNYTNNSDSNQYQSYQPYQHYQQRYNQDVNQGAPTATDTTLLRTSTSNQNNPQETTTANNQRSNYDHTRTPNRGRGRRFFGRGSRNNYQGRNQDGSDIDRETINFLAADQTIHAMFKPYLLEGTVNGKKMIFLRDSGATRSFLRSDLVESKDIIIDKQVRICTPQNTPQLERQRHRFRVPI